MHAGIRGRLFGRFLLILVFSRFFFVLFCHPFFERCLIL